MKAKTKPYGDEVIDFYGKKIPKVDSNYTFFAEIILVSALKNAEKYNPQVFLKECKYNEKEKNLFDILLMT